VRSLAQVLGGRGAGKGRQARCSRATRSAPASPRCSGRYGSVGGGGGVTCGDTYEMLVKER